MIFPYIGGEEVNSSPTHDHHRYVINFGERREEECRREWPELMTIVERKVKPDRMKNNREGYRRYWWHYGEKRNDLYRTIQDCKSLLANSQVSSHICFGIVSTGQVYGHTLYVYQSSTFDNISLLQSSIHSLWGSLQGSSLGDGGRYTAASSFETFPFPAALLDSAASDPTHEATRHSLEAIGERYHQFRAELMVANNEGLTSTYNRFHDPAETSSGLLELRRLHGEMDQTVLAAYGWSDVSTACGFGLDYLDLEDDAQLPDELQQRIDDGNLFFWDAGDALDFQGQLTDYGAITGRRKLPWRYRWPDSVRDDVLARLLVLNAERYEEEVAMGLHSKGGKQAAKASRAVGGSVPGGKGRGRPPKTPPPDSGQTIQIGLVL